MHAASRPAKVRVAKGRASRTSTEIVARPDATDSRAMHTVRFGDVTVTGPQPSTAALKRALPFFLRPGIRIYPKKDVPLFWADEDNLPEGVIRKLNGKIERGVVDEDGNFKVTD